MQLYTLFSFFFFARFFSLCFGQAFYLLTIVRTHSLVPFFNRRGPEQTGRKKRTKRKIEPDSGHDSKGIRRAKRLGKPGPAMEDKKKMHGLGPILMGAKGI